VFVKFVRSIRQGVKSLYPPVSPEQQQELMQHVVHHNLPRMLVVASLLVSLMLTFLLLESLFHNHIASPYFGKDLTLLIIIRIVLVFGSVLFLMTIDIPATPRDITRRHVWHWQAFMLFFIIATGALTYALQPYRVSFNSYVLSMFVVTALFILPVGFGRILFGSAYLIMVGILFSRYTGIREFVFDIFGATMMPLFAHLMSRILYTSWVQNYFNRHLIEQQNEGLESANRQLAENNRILQNLAVLDGIGVTPNRRYFEALLDREWKRAYRLKTTLSVVIIRIEQFDDFVSRYGQKAGDECVIHITRALMRQAGRSSDVVARFRDNRYGVLLPDTDCDGADVVARRMQKVVADLGIIHEDTSTKTFELSWGCSSCTPDDENDALSMISHAEAALVDSCETLRKPA